MKRVLYIGLFDRDQLRSSVKQQIEQESSSGVLGFLGMGSKPQPSNITQAEFDEVAFGFEHCQESFNKRSRIRETSQNVDYTFFARSWQGKGAIVLIEGEVEDDFGYALVESVRNFDTVDTDTLKAVEAEIALHYRESIEPFKSTIAFNVLPVAEAIPTIQPTERRRRSRVPSTVVENDRVREAKGTQNLPAEAAGLANYPSTLGLMIKYPEATKSILAGLAVAAIVLSAVLTAGLSVAAGAGIAAASFAVSGGLTFFALNHAKQNGVLAKAGVEPDNSGAAPAV